MGLCISGFSSKYMPVVITPNSSHYFIVLLPRDVRGIAEDRIVSDQLVRLLAYFLNKYALHVASTTSKSKLDAYSADLNLT